MYGWWGEDGALEWEVGKLLVLPSGYSFLAGEAGADWVLAATRTFSALRRPDLFSFFGVFKVVFFLFDPPPIH